MLKWKWVWMFHIFFPNWHLPMSPESRNGNIKPEKRSAALQQDVLCASLLPPAVCFSPGRLFNQWSESAHQQKSWRLSHLQRQKSKSHTFIRRRLCKDCCSGGLSLMGGRVRRRACELHKVEWVFFFSVCFCASAASGSDGWPWLCVLTGLNWD